MLNIEDMARVLNELLAADPDAANEFFHLGVPVNRQVCDHPTIQVRGDRTKPDSAQVSAPGVLRPLGLLNGLVQDGNKVIVMTMDASEKMITGFTIGILDGGKVKAIDSE